MDLHTIPEIRVETAGNEATYWLPARPLGKIRWLGLILVGFSVFWISGVGRMLADVLRDLSKSKQPGFQYFFIAFLLVFVLVGCIPAFYGLLLMFGRCRVIWRNGRLMVSDSVGPFGWRRRMPRAAIRKFEVKAGASSKGRPIATGPLASLAMLVAEFEIGKPRIVAMGYPREWLEAIAADLSGRAASSQAAAPRVEVTDANENPPQFHDVLEKPAGSKIVIQRQNASIVLDVPAAGLRKGVPGLFVFSIAWCVFDAVFTFAIAAGKMQQNSRDQACKAWLFMGGFWAVGLGMMALAVNLGRRRVTLTAGNSGLTVVQTGPFGVKRRELRRADIAAIRADESNVEVNGVRPLELQIHPVTSKKVGLFAGRDAGELRWMATELRKALGVGAGQEKQPSSKSL
jgi:hypothetical protein